MVWDKYQDYLTEEKKVQTLCSSIAFHWNRIAHTSKQASKPQEIIKSDHRNA